MDNLEGGSTKRRMGLGPIGKLYPSCTSGWYETEKDMKLEDVKPGLYYRAGDDVAGAVKSAKLVWAKASDEEEEEEEGGDTPSCGDDGGDEPLPPGGGGTLVDDPDGD